MRASPIFCLLLAAAPARSQPLAAPAHAEDAQGIKLALLDLEARSVDADLAGSVNELIGARIASLGSFDLITQQDVRHMVGFDRTRMALSCEDQASCLAEIGGALGVPYLLAGSLSALGEGTVLSLVLIDIDRARVLQRESLQASSVDALRQGAPDLAERVLAPLRQLHAGQLQVRSEPAEAEVHVDGKLVGVTPLEPIEIPAGPHRVEVRREGFIAFAQDLQLQSKERRTLEVQLKPSPEFLEAYRTEQHTRQGVALGAVGGGLLALVGSGGLFLWNELERLDICQRSGDPCSLFGREPAPASSDELGRQTARDVGGFALIGLAVGFAGAALYFWLSAEDPERYDHLAE